jgi:hypothetical protein
LWKHQTYYISGALATRSTPSHLTRRCRIILIIRVIFPDWQDMHDTYSKHCRCPLDVIDEDFLEICPAFSFNGLGMCGVV